ncbi:MAG TPA: RNA polymerase sigma factor [Syntrophomonadaceae bacterium]|nr:RNA polymerase sigma factor [Syntrophomonadaceae bacterium]
MRYLDRLIAKRIREGDVQAFEGLMVDFQARLFSYCIRMTNDYHAAEDLTQEIFIKVFKNIGLYDETKAALSTWIYTICRRTCLNYLRDYGREPYQPIHEDPMGAGGTGKDPYKFLEDRLLLIRALNELDPEDREMVILKDYLDLKYREIGRILILPTGTVKSRIHSIRTRLRLVLKGGE